jgi:hypothetical protein
MGRWCGLVAVGALLSVGCGDGGPDEPPPPPAPLRCDPPDPIECAMDVGETLPLRLTGDTTGADDGFGGASCGLGGDTVEDAAFRWTAPRADSYVFTTEGSTIDTFLSLRNGSCFGREFACNDEAEPGALHARIEVELRECERVMIVVDGPTVDSVGEFSLSVHGSEQLCDDGTDDDGDGAADCEDPDCFSAACPGDDLWPPDWRAAEWRVLDLVNQRRAEGARCGDVVLPPAPPLEMDATVRLAARLHSEDMAEQRYFAHDSLDGRTLDDRLREVSFGGAAPWGENILQGTASPEEAMAGWMSSPGHCENIMNPAYRVVGIGYALGAGGHRWTQDFAGSH